jgi:hypothetical protein
MFMASQRSGKSVFPNDLIQQALSAESFSVVFEFPPISGISLQPLDLSKVILFDSLEAAQEVAYAIRGDWDGCNGVEITDFDSASLELAASLAGAQWCEVGDSE